MGKVCTTTRIIPHQPKWATILCPCGGDMFVLEEQQTYYLDWGVYRCAPIYNIKCRKCETYIMVHNIPGIDRKETLLTEYERMLFDVVST